MPGPRQYPVSKELLDRYKLNTEYDSVAAISRKNSLLDPINTVDRLNCGGHHSPRTGHVAQRTGPGPVIDFAIFRALVSLPGNARSDRHARLKKLPA